MPVALVGWLFYLLLLWRVFRSVFFLSFFAVFRSPRPGFSFFMCSFVFYLLCLLFIVVSPVFSTKIHPVHAHLAPSNTQNTRQGQGMLARAGFLT